MFRFHWMIVIFLCYGTVAAAQATPEQEKSRTEIKTAYEKGDFDKCKELATRALAANPKDHLALYFRASSRVELGFMKHDAAEVRSGIEDARESLKIGGAGEINYYLPYLLGMITLANIEGKKEHATVALEIAKSVLDRKNLTPEQRANILYQRASAHLYLSELNLAIEDFQAAIKSFPGHIGSYMQLAQCYIMADDVEKALGAFTSAVEVFPNNPLAFNNRGLFLSQHNKPKEAIADFNKAIEIDGNFVLAYTNRGYTYQGEGNLQLAEADFTKALSLDPTNPLISSLRGSCRLSQGNTAGAIEDYNEAIRLIPENSVARADLGFAKFFSKDYAGASAAFEQSNQIDSVRMRYLSPWRAWSLVLAGKPDAVAPIAAISIKKTEKERDWIDQQVLFLDGKISEQEIVDIVGKTPEPKLKNAQLCEAYYFIGERRSQADDKKNATAFYQLVLTTKETQLSAYRGAQFALQAFGK